MLKELNRLQRHIEDQRLKWLTVENEVAKRTFLDAEKTYAKTKEVASLQSALSAEKEMPIHL